MLRFATGLASGAVVGYCCPKLDALAPYAAPVEDAMRALPFPKPQLKLTYFDAIGVAEKIRLTCALGALPFTDTRLSFPQWAAVKPTAKFGQLPLLEVDGDTYAQSGAMLAYVGKLTGLYPSHPRAALRVDEALGLHDDLGAAIRPSFAVMRDEALSLKERQRRQAEMRARIADTTLPCTFAHYERLLQASGSGWLAGPRPTVADMAVLAQLRWLTSGAIDGIPASCMDSYPQLKAFYARACSLPAVDKWLAAHAK